MRYRELPLPADLAADVQCLWELQGDADVFDEPVFPDGRIEIVIHLGAPPIRAGAAAPQPRMMIAGQMTSAITLSAVEPTHVIGIRFTPLGARRWLYAPLDEYTNRFVSLDDVRSDLSRLLATAAGDRDRMSSIVRILRETSRSAAAPPAALRAAVSATLASGGAWKVERLVTLTGRSRRQMERQFLHGLGLGPKTFQRIVRLQRALGALRVGHPAADVAAACGFADQPHLSREIRRVAGRNVGAMNLARVPFLLD